MDDRFAAAFAQLPALLAAHLLLSAAALALALVIGLPLAIVAARRPVLAQVALGVAGLIQTIPGLALLALFYPLLLALSALVGGGIPALGFLPSLLALALYALLPILRNGVTGLAGIDPAVLEAADGLGMTPGQRLRLIEAPLAAPVVMAGIRTAAVWTIGAATLATTVGAASLGNLIFAGLQTENIALVLVGCIGAAGLAIVADLLLGSIERGVRDRRRARVIVPLGLIAAALVAALVGTFGGGAGKGVVTIGAKNFSEQYILAVRYREGLGSAVAFRALGQGDIDVYVEYSGTLWTGAMARKDVVPRAAMNRGIAAWMAAGPGTGLIGSLGFENAYALAMKADAAKARGIASIADLAARAPGLALGADLEFLDRPEWRTIRAAYGLRFRDQRAYSPTFMYRALSSGQADVISAFSSDGRIAADGLVVLTDPKGAVPAYDALLLVAPARARDARFVAALRPLIGAIPVARMRQANYLVDRDTAKATPEAAARWLMAR
jgi:osmoprotectant transport system permease protein